jgi:hypothetical protein
MSLDIALYCNAGIMTYIFQESEVVEWKRKLSLFNPVSSSGPPPVSCSLNLSLYIFFHISALHDHEIPIL